MVQVMCDTSTSTHTWKRNNKETKRGRCSFTPQKRTVSLCLVFENLFIHFFFAAAMLWLESSSYRVQVYIIYYA